MSVLAQRPSTTALSVQVRSLSSAMRDFDQFYTDHRDEIGRALTYTFGDASLGQEAVDEAMARAYQRWDTLGVTANPAGWVFVTGRRWGLSWLRGRRREKRREWLVADDEFVHRRADEVHPTGFADHVDLMNAMERLTVDQRTVVACRFSLGMSVAETAETLGIREGTVKSRLARSIDRLRHLIEERS